MINGLIGRRRRTDDVVELNPLVSNNTWDHFCLDRVPYRGKMLPILWYKTGPPYGKSTELRVFVHGGRTPATQTLARGTGELANRRVGKQ